MRNVTRGWRSVTGGGAWLSAWAKTVRDPQSKIVTGWLPLHEHLADSAAVAGLLVVAEPQNMTSPLSPERCGPLDLGSFLPAH